MKYLIELIENVIPETIGLDKLEKGRPLYFLEENFRFYINKILFVIPRGIVFDYASVPWGLHNVFPPYHPKYAAAALIHDWAYQGHIWDKQTCDLLFKAAMQARGFNRAKMWIMYNAVKFGGHKAYNSVPLSKIENIRKASGFSNNAKYVYGGEK